ncbi:MAG: type II toxin-antitoxin system VapC family toxin [Thermoleophilaceae bacterium]
MVVLDTHTWVWWLVRPALLGRRARELIRAEDEIGVAAISAWELGMLRQRGRIELDRPLGQWVRHALARPGVSEIPLTASIALAAGTLPEDFPRDPADRLIYATARAQGATLVTKDARMREFDPAGTVW